MKRILFIIVAMTLFIFSKLSAEPGYDVPDTLSDSTGVSALSDTLAADSTGVRKVEIVKRDFSYREQVGTALAIMAFVVLVIFGTTQNWNPS